MLFFASSSFMDKDQLQNYIQDNISSGDTVETAIEFLQTGYFASLVCSTRNEGIIADIEDVALVGYHYILCDAPTSVSGQFYSIVFIFQDGIYETVYINQVNRNALWDN